ncbi:MAG: alpha/beta fold hydrolase [Deltaproteobacteria bacterium]|nr:alpha/beta fold hydrolase [Deltaproteobacteria bacterium]
MENTEYKPPLLFKNGHIQTVFPSLFRKVEDPLYKRERIDTEDGDFLDLDWSKNGNRKIAIVSHGLEGSSDRSYVTGMVRALKIEGWDSVAWNFRSCSGETNRLLKMYHSGASYDLEAVINHVAELKLYDEIALVGFSMGGNITLVHLGQKGKDIHPLVKKAVTFSVPCDLRGSSEELKKPSSKIYMKRFLRMLKEKIEEKAKLMPGKVDIRNFDKITDFKGFDDRYTAPFHGFKDAYDYWEKCSSKQFIENIKIPTLIVNAKNDPFLSESCYPITEAENNRFVTLETPSSGGHVGFVSFNSEKVYWSEKRTISFINGK